jgi:hypothetical protein
MNAGAYFEVQEAVIKSKRGDGLIIFQGMQNHTADSIKSLEGYDRAWVEEAQSPELSAAWTCCGRRSASQDRNCGSPGTQARPQTP